MLLSTTRRSKVVRERVDVDGVRRPRDGAAAERQRVGFLARGGQPGEIASQRRDM